jgi:hypothetical protein
VDNDRKSQFANTDHYLINIRKIKINEIFFKKVLLTGYINDRINQNRLHSLFSIFKKEIQYNIITITKIF